MPLLICDLDDTLVQRAPLFRVWAERFLAEQGFDPGLLDWMVEADHGGHVPRRVFHARLAEIGYARPYDEFVAAHEEAVSGGYRLTPDVVVALDEAQARGWVLGVVTNGYVHRQTTKIEAVGVERFAGVCISQEVGVSKPDPAIFRLVAERAGTTLDGAWMIGDNLDADIAGARAAGIRSVWVRRPREWLTFDSGTVPDLVAEDFADAVRQVLSATEP